MIILFYCIDKACAPYYKTYLDTLNGGPWLIGPRFVGLSYLGGSVKTPTLVAVYRIFTLIFTDYRVIWKAEIGA